MQYTVVQGLRIQQRIGLQLNQLGKKSDFT